MFFLRAQVAKEMSELLEQPFSKQKKATENNPYYMVFGWNGGQR